MRRSRSTILAFAACLTLGLVAGWWFFVREPPLPRNSSGIRYDPVEDDPRVQQYFEAADKEASVANAGGKAPGYFRHKKRILKEKYGIDWRTPAELNPNYAYD